MFQHPWYPQEIYTFPPFAIIVLDKVMASEGLLMVLMASLWPLVPDFVFAGGRAPTTSSVLEPAGSASHSKFHQGLDIITLQAWKLLTFYRLSDVENVSRDCHPYAQVMSKTSLGKKLF